MSVTPSLDPAPSAQRAVLAAADGDGLLSTIRNTAAALGFGHIGVAGVDLRNAEPGLQAWLEQTLLAERNHNWLKKWSTLPNESFIVVGALHLYGDQGLLALLEQQGWRITPLTEPGPRKPARQ